MLNVSEEVKALYKSSSAPITLQLRIGNTTYTDRNVVAGSMSITESLCSLETFSLSTVEKNELVFSLFNEEQEISSLIGQTVVASHIVTLANDTTETVPLGTYTIVDAVKDGDYIFTCTCYDAMLAFDAIVDDWWNEDVQFPITTKALAESLFTELNLTYSLPTTFVNSDFEIAVRPTYFENIKASEVLGYLQEVTGGFFKADRQGTIRFYGMRQFTNGVGFGENASVIEYTYRHMFGELNISDYDINKITSLQIRGTENDVGIIVGTGTNLFIIEGNPLLYNVTEDDRPMATNIFNAIKDITYTPFSGEVVGLPFVEVGDCINATTYKNATVNSPILYRVLSNQKLSVDSFTTKGEKQRPVTKTLNRAITVLNQKTHEIVNTVDTLSSTITNVQSTISGLDARITTNTSNITQNASQIALKVSQSDYTGANIVNLINLDTSGATIQATHVVVDTSSLDLTFGSETSNVTIRATDENDGVLFDGSGKVHFETNGEFKATNYDTDDIWENEIELNNSSTRSHLRIANRWEGKSRNFIYSYATATTGYIAAFNRDTTGADMNFIRLDYTPSSNWNRILIQNNWISGNRSNWIQCSNANTTSDFQFWNYNTSGQYANRFTMTSNSTNNSVTLANHNTSATNVNSITLYSTTTDTQNYVNITNRHNNGNLANTIYMHSENNSGALAITNRDLSGVTRTALYMNADGTFRVQTLVNNSQKCLIQASSYGNLDLVTTGALHFNAGSITVQYGNTYKTGAGSGGNPTGTDNVAVKNWDNSTVNLHFANGLYIGWSKAS